MKTSIVRDSWHQHLPKVIASYNAMPHSTTGFSPASLVFPREGVTKLLDSRAEAANRTRTHAERRRDKVAKRLVADDLAVEDLVFYKRPLTKKFEPPWIGPFRVTKVLSFQTFEIQRDNITLATHRNSIKKVAEPACFNRWTRFFSRGAEM
jgi:hypothetical protein